MLQIKTRNTNQTSRLDELSQQINNQAVNFFADLA